MSLSQSATPNNKWRLAWLVISLLALLTSIGWLASAETELSKTSPKATSPLLPLISITEASVKPATIEVSAFSQTKPRWSVDIKSTVNGKVIEVSAKASTGSYVTKGDLLAVIDDTPYKAEVAQMSLQLAQAKQQLALAQGNTLIAKRQYRKRNNSAANDLALQLPQLRVAKKAVTLAKARLLVAKQQLANTRVTAPFSGYITQRQVSLGQQIASSDTLVRLEDSNTLTLKVELSQAQWQRIKQPIIGSSAQLLDSEKNFLTTAQVLQGGGYLDPKTRQVAVYLEVTQARAKSLLAGQFVQVKFAGISYAKTLTLPASSLTQEGFIWSLSGQNRLERLTPQLLMRKQQQLVIQAPQDTSSSTDNSWRIATTPLAAFLPGQQVQVRN